ncbi:MULTISPECIES: S26 family signal peptidase [unclassified Novosphingobium]|uniref:S26 family signal peptidase n=1 Tax=unclassified Novosphingobium TaxID=2644732 RepID=UPI001469CC74|nr:conjugative transfer signal peptidase TraF [Novosphingobium sp. SG919]NMN87058.1 conjugative transfer signal peptidase TraF [Novosphingobium sp. SG916]
MSGRRNAAPDAPLLAWGEALRARKQARRRQCRRLFVLGLGSGLVVGSALLPPVPCLVWNASASAPVGLYWLSPGTSAATGDMVVARVPEPFRTLAATRRYLPRNVPLVKRVAAEAGDRVCARGVEVLVNGRPVATRQQRDALGRVLPWWQGCRVLRLEQVFLLMDSADSFDGRYFGVSEGVDLIGKARLLWRR